MALPKDLLRERHDVRVYLERRAPGESTEAALAPLVEQLHVKEAARTSAAGMFHQLKYIYKELGENAKEAIGTALEKYDDSQT